MKSSYSILLFCLMLFLPSTENFSFADSQDFGQHVFLVPQAYEINSLDELDGATICVTKPDDSKLVEKFAAYLSISLLQKSGSFENFLSGICDVAIVDANSVTDKDKLVTYDVFNHKSEKLYPDGVYPLARSFVKPNTVPALITGNDGITRWEDHKVRVCEYKNGESYEFGFNPSTASSAYDCQEWIWR